MRTAGWSSKGAGLLRAAGPGILCSVVLLLPGLSCLLPKTLEDPDVWWHLRTAQWIVDHRALPQVDEFSWTSAQTPWIAYSWLAELLLWGLYQSFGLKGLLLYTGAMATAIGLACYALFRHLGTDPVRSAILVLVAALGLLPLLTPRPWLFSVLLFVFELDLLLWAGRTANRWVLLGLVPLFALWANTHIQCMTGLMVLGLAVAEPVAIRVLVADRAPAEWRAIGFPWLLLVFALCVAATLCNPYHVRLYSVALQLLGQTRLWDRIQELTAMSFRSPSDWAVLGAALAAAFAVGRRPIRPWLVAALLASVYFGFRSCRDAWMVLATGLATVAYLMGQCGRERRLLGPAPLPRPSNRELAEPPPAALDSGSPVGPSCVTLPAQAPARRAQGLAVAAAVAIGWVSAWALVSPGPLEAKIAQLYPTKAVEFIASQHLSGPMFNVFHWGGYLMYFLPELPVGIDGRTMVHGEERIVRNAKSIVGQQGWQEDPDLAQARLVVVPRKCALASLLACNARFRLAYQDQVASVFCADAPGSQLARHAFDPVSSSEPRDSGRGQPSPDLPEPPSPNRPHYLPLSAQDGPGGRP